VGEIALLALGLMVVTSTGVITWLGMRMGGRRYPTVDPALKAAIRALSPEGRVRLEACSVRRRSRLAIVITGICDKLWLGLEDAEGRPPGVAVELSLRREEQIPVARAPDLETDDPNFDAAFRVLGPPPIVHAILTDPVRLELVKLQHLADVEVMAEKGELRLLVEGPSASREDTLKELAIRALELAPGLAVPDDLPGRLAQNALGSQKAGVRLRQLLTLSREYPDNPIARNAFRAATKDRDLEVRLRAGIALGGEGRDVLLSLALNPHADDSCASRAVDALGAALTPQDAARLCGRGPLLARSAVAALAHAQKPESVPVLGRVLMTLGGDLAAQAAQALADLNLPDAERPLIEALAAPDDRARLAAAEALAQVGTVVAVASLEDAGHRWGGELQKVARRAVAEIQGRLVGAEPGQVSLAGESEAGGLSLADDRGGEVSLSGTDDRGKR
jgi:hypothetical protein